MTDILPFRRPEHDVVLRSSLSLEPGPPLTVGPDDPPHLDVALVRGERRRRYWIRPGKNPGEWYTQVYFGKSQHRAAILYDLIETHRLYTEYGREIEEAIQDGWCAVEVLDGT